MSCVGPRRVVTDLDISRRSETIRVRPRRVVSDLDISRRSETIRVRP